MTTQRRTLLARAALCFEQAGQPEAAARCRERAGELIAAAELYRTVGDLSSASVAYRRAGHTAEAVSCLLSLGRAEDAAELWREAGAPLEAAWVLALDARRPERARTLLAGIRPGSRGEALRLRLADAVCAAHERRPDVLVGVLRDIDRELPDVRPAAEQARLVQWAVPAADHLHRPDLGSMIFASAYRCRVRGIASRWQEWARSALGGAAGVPERDL